MTTHPDLTSQAIQDSGAIEEIQFLDHRIRFGPTHTGWVSFVARPGQRPTIILASERETLLAQSHKLVEQRIAGRR
ncbi:hypothetical protein DC522_28785 [Microvirga sp. KLBC 81]|uniref:hypothetical protein n=1 Tax=Microvirga sp. KLBC 81 TaxID=1862707 RepID=UPI000D513E53|nr:hypothetical protein [Microvirga sp. KLBC 81]PVE21052.1 hypothetical protein DC522_28785 [Microvirga sp. KLBC 81]